MVTKEKVKTTDMFIEQQHIIYTDVNMALAENLLDTIQKLPYHSIIQTSATPLPTKNHFP